MSICLNMIVRDEVRNVPRIFNSLKGIIDYYVIVDTGSKDGTIEAIEKAGADLKIAGKVFPLEWENDYAGARQFALDLALIHSPCSHILTLDADEEFLGMPGHWKEALKTEYSYRIPKFYGRFRNDHPNLISQAVQGWRWEGKLHEELSGPGLINCELFHWGKIISHPDEGCRGRGRSIESKLEADADVLLEMLTEERSPRTLYYLAKTFKELRAYDSALLYYEERRHSGGDEQQTYRAYLDSALILQELGEDTELVEKAFTNALTRRPGRLESYYYLSRHYQQNNKPTLAYIFAKAGLEKMHTPDSFMLESDIYEWRMFALYCRICLRMGKIREMGDIYETLMDDVQPTYNTIEFANEKLNLVTMRREFGEPVIGE